MRQTYRGSATKPVLGEDSEKKKTRNRLSQQAFRKRQSDYIRELEKRIESFDKSDNERIFTLQEENKKLRQQLNKIVHRLYIAQSGLASLSRSANEALQCCDNDEAVVDETPESSRNWAWRDLYVHDEAASCSNLPNSKHAANPTLASLTDSNDYGANMLDQSLDLQIPEGSGATDTLLIAENFEMNSTGRAEAQRGFEQNTADALLSTQPLQSELSITSIPGVWLHQYQMGPGRFRSALSASVSMTGALKATNSHFSDHIYRLQQFLRRKWTSEQSVECTRLTLPQLQIYASLLLSMFNTVARTPAMSWYNRTKFHDHIAKVTVWQIHRTREMYTVLPAKYKPSALQLTETYPPIIDWHPFSSVRDRLIQFHAANPYIDSLISELGTAYVVETDLSKLVKMEQPTLGFVRVWDIIQAMGEPDDCISADPTSLSSVDIHSWQTFPNQRDDQIQLSLPAPNPEALFSTREYAHLAFETLRMNEGVSLFKLDPAVFEKYPELYDPDCPFVASGMPLRPSVRTVIPGPTPLDAATLNKYHHFAGWAYDLVSKIPQSSTSLE